MGVTMDMKPEHTDNRDVLAMSLENLVGFFIPESLMVTVLYLEAKGFDATKFRNVGSALCEIPQGNKVLTVVVLKWAMMEMQSFPPDDTLEKGWYAVIRRESGAQLSYEDHDRLLKIKAQSFCRMFELSLRILKKWESGITDPEPLIEEIHSDYKYLMSFSNLKDMICLGPSTKDYVAPR